MPGNAGQAIFTTGQDTSTLSPWAGLAMFALYAAPPSPSPWSSSAAATPDTSDR